MHKCKEEKTQTVTEIVWRKNIYYSVFLLIILMMNDQKVFTVKEKAVESLYTREKAGQDTII